MTNVPILVYHHVYPEGTPELKAATGESAAGVIGEAEFRRHMDFISTENWNVVSTSDVVDWIIDGTPLPDRALALHFDNGWLDTRTVTMPIVKAFGMTATCFPITDGVEAATEGQIASVRTLTEGQIEKPFMTWQQVGELSDEGWEIGAHTATHPKVAEKHAEEGDDGVLWEVETSNALFRKRLGMIPQHFAYPSGSRNDRTDELLGGIYRSLRLWHFEYPVVWTFTSQSTSPMAIDCQNIDARVSFDDFKRIFDEAVLP